MSTWPTSLGNPQFSGFDIETVDQTIRTDMDGGAARVRRRSTAAPDHVSLRFMFDQAQMAAFRVFWDYDFAGGAAWCYVPIKDARSSGVSLRECRPLNAKFKAVPVSNSRWAVDFQVEAKKATSTIFDLINAMGLPSLSLDFAGTKSLYPVVVSSVQPTPSISFSRASVATYFDASGAIQTAAINEPRFDHNPTTGESKGLLIEEARTNLLLNSAALSTQTITVTAASRTISFYGSGSVVLSGAHSATVSGSGAFPARTAYTYTPSAGSMTITVTGSVQYANDELGPFATSWIPTASISMPRLSDDAYMAGVNFSSWFRQDSGALIVEFSLPSVTGSSDPSARIPCAISDGSYNNSFYPARFALSANLKTTYLNGVTNQSESFAVITTTAGQRITSAVAYSANDLSESINGAITGSDVSASLIAPNQLHIGSNWLGNGQWLCGHIRRLEYYPTRKTNAELQALSA